MARVRVAEFNSKWQHCMALSNKSKSYNMNNNIDHGCCEIMVSSAVIKSASLIATSMHSPCYLASNVKMKRCCLFVWSKKWLYPLTPSHWSKMESNRWSDSSHTFIPRTIYQLLKRWRKRDRRIYDSVALKCHVSNAFDFVKSVTPTQISKMLGYSALNQRKKSSLNKALNTETAESLFWNYTRRAASIIRGQNYLCSLRIYGS